MKRYRRPKVAPGEIKMQMGKVDGEIEMTLTWGDGVPGCDRSLFFNVLCGERMHIDLGSKGFKPAFSKSFMDELEQRGYDMDTLRISVRKKAEDLKSDQE